MFVGFDPGTTAALALIDLRGNLVLLKTFKGGLGEAISILKNYDVVVVSSDKKDMPAVKKLAASFGAIVYFPKEDLKVNFKRKITKKFNPSNDHERDSLAAALMAYKKYRRTAEKVLKKETLLLKELLHNKVPNLSLKQEEKEVRPLKKRSRNLLSRVNDLERKLKLAELALDAERKKVIELKKRPTTTIKKKVPLDYKQERRARIRLEKELLEAHSRINKLEFEFEKLKKAKPEVKENIRERILRMLKEYKERFRR